MLPGRSTREKGREGETLARKYLRRHGMRILQMNYQTQTGEIDIIAQDDDTIVFVEVKASGNDRFGDPAERVTRNKQDRLIRTARCYVQEKGLNGKPLRFDVVAIDKEKNINHIRDAFTVDGY